MKILRLFFASLALVAASVTGAAASAATLLVSYTPTTDNHGAFSFEVDSNPTPLAFSSFNFSVNLTNATGQYVGVPSIIFVNINAGGGLGDYYGAQLFSGSPSAPSLISGTFTLFFLDDSSRAGTLTISDTAAAVPETATWAMMLAGFGAVGFAVRRRSNIKTTVAYT